MKNIEIEKIVNEFAKNFDAEEIFIFGSFASGKSRKDSDLNLLVITKKIFGTKEKFEIASRINEDFPEILITPLIYEKKEFETLKNMNHPLTMEILAESSLVFKSL